MSHRFQRLFLIIISIILFSGALTLILINSKNNIIFFYTPSELIVAKEEINKPIRIGGFVKKNSIKKASKINKKITFVITDNKNDIFVEYNDILPNMFRENQGAVVEGTLTNNNTIVANKVFAKHDENYMPASIKKQIEKSDYWKKDYSLNSLSYEAIPNFTSVNLIDNNMLITHNDIKENIVIINFFASWCIPCKTEHPLLMNLKKRFPQLTILGFNHKDEKENAIKFLSTNGNPYSFVGVDLDGKIGLEFGVMGLPETLLTNNQGKIVYRHLGPLTNKVIQKEILPNL